MNSKILIVEDEAKLREILCDYFSSKGELPVEASNGIQALELIDENEFDAVLLDIMMPELDGLSVCRAVRRTNDVPIIFLTALSDEEDKLLGYELGADDYVTVGYNPLELLARVKSQLRRYTQLVNLCESIDSIYRVDGLEINDRNRTVTVDGREVKMTPIEYKILRLLVQERGKVLSISQIYESIWHMQAIGADNTIAVHIRHIREKIESNPKEPRYLKVVWGTGYKVG